LFSFVVWLALRGGHGYSVHDTQAHSIDYGNVIREGHGGMTAFLWLSFVSLFTWTGFYLGQHWYEFARLLAWS
jgi:hypothetical protein